MKHPTTSPSRPGHAGHSSTLLVFTLGASWEARRRSLLPDGWGQAEQALHRACFDGVLAAGRANGCRITVSTPTVSLALPEDVERLPQSGKDFGARLRGAWAGAQERSDGPLVLVGSDVPGLGSHHIRQALAVLTKNPDRVVIGPSLDGGFYLLASNRPLDSVLASVRWCCPRTLSSLRKALAREGLDFILLAPLRDLDRRSDLEILLAPLAKSVNTTWRNLFRWLLLAWRRLRRPLSLEPAPVPVTNPRSVRRGRAPPDRPRSL